MLAPAGELQAAPAQLPTKAQKPRAPPRRGLADPPSAPEVQQDSPDQLPTGGAGSSTSSPMHIPINDPAAMAALMNQLHSMGLTLTRTTPGGGDASVSAAEVLESIKSSPVEGTQGLHEGAGSAGGDSSSAVRQLGRCCAKMQGRPLVGEHMGLPTPPACRCMGVQRCSPPVS